jgi:thiopeptide-type bacteriocin biosynthesis protein
MAKKEPLYTALDHVAVRAPLLPVERYGALAGADALPDMRRQLDEPRVRCAMTLGSPSLVEALERGASDARKAAQQFRGLLRYFIRMSTRATPYGLFAGISLAHWGEATTLSLSDAEPPTHARPDMQWLLSLVERLDSRPEIRQGLRWRTHPAAVVRSGRVLLFDPPPYCQARDSQWVSVRALGVVQFILSAARRPLPHAELMRQLLQAVQGATPEKLEPILTQLWSQGLLITDLYPPLLTRDPVAYVLERLSGLPAAEPERRELEAISQELAAWDRLPFSEKPAAHARIVQRALTLHPLAEGSPVQVDMALPLAGRVLSRRVGDEVARAAELVLRLSPKQGRPAVDEYRRRFLERYGAWTEVPLLELVDPTVGLGPLGTTSDDLTAFLPALRRRTQTLLHLAVRAQRERQRILELDDATLKMLEGPPLRDDELPRSLELFVTVAAASARALDAGDFKLVIQGADSVPAAGRSLGRFVHLLGEEAHEALQKTARAEEALAPDRRFAEVSYMPRSGRGANVCLRPMVRGHELALSTQALEGEGLLSLDSLVVGVREGRFYVRSPELGADVVLTTGHMLNSQGAPALVHFLAGLSLDGQRQLNDFDWGLAQGFPMLPRLQRGRVVLSPARWRITPATRDTELPLKDPATFARALQEWRARWDVPRRVCLTALNNDLLLDLDCPAHVEELRLELEARCDAGVILIEALPDVDQAWLEGPGGHFQAELAVPLVLRAPPGTPERTRSQGRARPARARAPGMGWSLARLCCPALHMEELITGPLRTFGEEALREGRAEAWSFLRSNAPEPELRLLLRGNPEVLTDRLMPALCRWGAGLMEQGRVRRFVLDTYEPEPGRHGGEGGLAVAESLFAADSRAVAELLGLLLARKVGVDRSLLAVLTADELLAGLGLSEEARLAWCERFVRAQPAGGVTYRQHAAALRTLLGSDRWARFPGGAEVERLLLERRAALAPLGARLQELAACGELLHPPEELYGYYLQLHSNRLLGTDGEQSLELLLRTRRTLARLSPRGG